MTDQRSAIEKKLWELIGPPLYYCEGCLRAVNVKTFEDGRAPEIKKPCECDCQVIAPRKAIAAGEGGLNWKDTIKVNYWQLAAALTGRCV